MVGMMRREAFLRSLRCIGKRIRDQPGKMTDTVVAEAILEKIAALAIQDLKAKVHCSLQDYQMAMAGLEKRVQLGVTPGGDGKGAEAAEKEKA